VLGLTARDELRIFVPLLFATFFLYTGTNGPLSAVILDVVPGAVAHSVAERVCAVFAL